MGFHYTYITLISVGRRAGIKNAFLDCEVMFSARPTFYRLDSTEWSILLALDLNGVEICLVSLIWFGL